MKKISRKQFNRMGLYHYGLSKEACRQAWLTFKFRRGTDLYGDGQAERSAFCNFVNFVSSNFDA